MSQVYTFSETAIGHLHVMNEFPCEDSSMSFSSKDNKYSIAIVADGHGSKKCFRSSFGAKTATKIAMECLQQFAEVTLSTVESENRFYQDMFSNPRYRQMALRRLTDTIVASWYDCVLEDYDKNPPTVDEMGESAAEYAGGKSPAHIYGTTLIAALQMPKCLILLQQGDGRCSVFYSDGTIDQPIPWDSRCEDTSTTSLCDEDAADSFRNYIINLDEKQVIACYLGSDGVEDAYRDTYDDLGGSHTKMGGVYTFYKYLTCQLSKLGPEAFTPFLRDELPNFSANGKFSRSGSGDDVSVAGIVTISEIHSLVDRFDREIKCYSLEEELFGKEEELRSKTRKHGILQKRLADIKAALSQERVIQNDLQVAVNHLREQRDEFADRVEKAKSELDAYQQDSQSATEQMNGKYSRFAAAVQRFIDDISSGFSQKEASYRKMLEKLIAYDDQIKEAEESHQASTRKCEELEVKCAEAQATYDEYNEKYLAIEADRERVVKELATLSEEIVTLDTPVCSL